MVKDTFIVDNSTFDSNFLFRVSALASYVFSRCVILESGTWLIIDNLNVQPFCNTLNLCAYCVLIVD
jgi:hypothetical protein